MLDSGAYSAFTRGKEIDIDQYAEYCKIHGHMFECCVTLDVIGDGKRSYENWLYLRKKGLDILPVYHIGTDEKWLVKYLKKTEYIGLGAVAKVSSAQRMLSLSRIWQKYLIDRKSIPVAKVHGMGLTAMKIMTTYPWYSIDSTTAVLAAGYGGVFLPAIRKGKRRWLGMNVYKVSDQFHHQTSNFTTFVNMPKTLQKIYNEYFEKLGFKLGVMTGVKNRLTNDQEKIENLPPKLFDLTELTSNQEEGLTLANSSRIRRRWNQRMYWEFMRHMPPWQRPYGVNMLSPAESRDDRMILYMGGTLDALEDIIDANLNKDLSAIFSYFIVGKNFIPRIQGILK